MPAPFKPANDKGNQVFFAGVQTDPFTAATVTHRMNGKPRFNGLPPITFDEDANGTRFTMTTPVQGVPENTGTLAQSISASYERLPSWLRMLCQSGSAPASGTGPDYQYEQILAPIEDNVDLETWIFGVPGLYERAQGVRLSSLNVAADISDSNAYWQLTPQMLCSKWELLMGFEGVATSGATNGITMTGAGWTVNAWVGAYVYFSPDSNITGARRILSNTATALTIEGTFPVTPANGDKFLISFLPPAGIPQLSEEKIKTAGTKLFIDTTSALGTTQILRRFISFNIDMVPVDIENKAFMENEFDRSGVYGFGRWDVTGQIRLEFDRPTEIRQLLAMSDLKIRIEKTGSLLAPGIPRMARIDMSEANWVTRDQDERNNNLTQTLAFRATAQTTPIKWITRNGLSALPN